jgi:outer membrane protein TolC
MNTITNDRAVRRYLQIRVLQEQAELLEETIAAAQKTVDTAEELLRECRIEKAAVVRQLRDAAADQATLPSLDDLEEQIAKFEIPASVRR